MNHDPLSDGKIIACWQRNASPWTNAVRAGEIDSRRLVTDRAVLDAVLACNPATVLDLGCGEGWLALALQRHGIHVTAVDVIAEPVRAATDASVVDARTLSYEEIAARGLARRRQVSEATLRLARSTPDATPDTPARAYVPDRDE
ncbi:class I SAM-dependent methyltransferase [Paraburkholderia sp. 40]|uniref:class I SAM-dependent methyltransferase n=1 Tax=Paraburkholderia sp. 40 TaxID=2991059 RepID=UPI003D19FF9A